MVLAHAWRTASALELVSLEEVHVPSDAMLLQPIGRATVRLATKPVDSLDGERLRVCKQLAIASNKFDTVGRDGICRAAVPAAHAVAPKAGEHATWVSTLSIAFFRYRIEFY